MAMLRVNNRYTWYGETGSGVYGRTLGKQTCKFIDQVRDKVLGMVRSIPFSDKSSVFNIGDYGTADGAASMVFIRDLIVTLKEVHGPKVQFQIIYEDQETNDFNSLFKYLAGINPADSPSYLLQLDNVFPLASGLEFRKQCVPSNSMHFIMSVSAIHWLSNSPVMFKDSLYIHPKCSEEEKKALLISAKEDWETFLLMRSKELKQGGILLVITGYRSNDDSYVPTISLDKFISLLTDIWIFFRNTGRITKEEFHDTNFPLHFYSLDELRESFEDTSSKVYKSGLRLLSSEVQVLKCAFHTAWKKKKEQTGVDDREEFARNCVAAHRNWSHSTFLHGLSYSRPEEEKRDILEELFQMAEKKITEMDPDQFVSDLMYSCLIIRKE